MFDTPGTDVATPDAGSVPRNSYGQYVLPNPDDPTKGKWINTQHHGRVFGVASQRTSTFAKIAADNYALNKWYGRMSIYGLTMDDGLYARAASLTLEDRDELNAIAEKAAEVAGAKTRASIGTALHTFTERIDRGEEPRVPARWAPELAAYVRLRDQVGMQLVEIERVIVAPQYGLGGTFDRIVTFAKDITIKFPGKAPIVIPAGTPVIVDLKTGRDLTYGWGEIAVQLTVYTDAPLMWIWTPQRPDGTIGVFERKPITDDRVVFVIHVPVRDNPGDSLTAVLYAIDAETGRAAVQLTAAVRAWRKVRNLAVPLAKVTVTEADAMALDQLELTGPPPGTALAIPTQRVPTTVSALTYAERIAVATSPAELSAIWREADARGHWTPELEALGHKRIAQLRTA